MTSWSTARPSGDGASCARSPGSATTPACPWTSLPRQLDFSKSKLYRLENGRSRITTDDLEDMLDLYGVTSPQREALIRLNRDARKRGWWTAYSDVFTGSYISMESEADSIRINTDIVPGLFQIADYARAVMTRTRQALTAEETERTVLARTARQRALLEQDHPPEIHLILDEAVLHRQVGSPEVIAGQLVALAEVSNRPHVTVQVLAFSAGAHAGMDGKFTILTFPGGEDPPIAYVEGLMGDIYLESEEELDRYHLAWTRLITEALNPDESVAMIRELAKDAA